MNIKLLTSTQVQTKIPPQWIDESTLCYASTHNFIMYSTVDQQLHCIQPQQLLSKPSAQIICANFSKYLLTIQAYYIIQYYNNSEFPYYSLQSFNTPLRRSIMLPKGTKKVNNIWILQAQNIALVETEHNNQIVLLTICLCTSMISQMVLKQQIINMVDYDGQHILGITTSSVDIIKVDTHAVTSSLHKRCNMDANHILYANVVTVMACPYMLFITKQQFQTASSLQLCSKPNPNSILINTLHTHSIDEHIHATSINNTKIIIAMRKCIGVYTITPDLNIEHSSQVQLVQDVILWLGLSPSALHMVVLGVQNSQLSMKIMQCCQSQYCMMYQIQSLHHPISEVSKLRTGCVGAPLLVLNGDRLYTLQQTLAYNVMDFCVHPLQLFLAISLSLTVKIYALKHNSITLIESQPWQGVLCMQYHPMGHQLLLMFNRSVQVLDAYTFHLYHHITHKSAIKNIMVTPATLYIITQTNSIYSYDTLYYQQFAHFSPNNQQIRIIRTNQIAFYLCLLYDDGTLCFKSTNLNPNTQGCSLDGAYQQKIQYDTINCKYRDKQHITALEICQNYDLIVIGLRSGKIRIYNEPFQWKQTFLQNCCRQITITCPSATPFIYVGTSIGNISSYSYELTHYSRISYDNLKYTSHAQRYLKLGEYPSYTLNPGAQQIEAQITQLQCQLRHLNLQLDRPIRSNQSHLNSYKYHKQILAQQSQTKQHQILQLCHNQNTSHNQQKLNLIRQSEEHQSQIHSMILSYNQQMKNLQIEKKNLQEKKAAFIKNGENYKQQLIHQLKRQYEVQVNTQKQKIKAQKIRSSQMEAEYTYSLNSQEALIIPDSDLNTDIFVEYLCRLQQQLQQEQKKGFQLKKQNVYLKNYRQKLQESKVQEESLQFRIQQQIGKMHQAKQHQLQIQSHLQSKIKHVENNMHKVQNKTQTKAVQFTKVAQKDQINDECSYKLWFKDNTVEQLKTVQDKFNQIERIIKQKRAQISAQIAFKKNQQNKIQQITQKKRHLTQKRNEANFKVQLSKQSILQHTTQYNQNALQLIKAQKTVNHNRNNSTGQTQGKHTTNYNNREDCFRRINCYERTIQQSNTHLRKSIQNTELKFNKLNMQNSTMLHQYMLRKFQNKQLVDKQQQKMIEMHPLQHQLEFNPSLQKNNDQFKSKGFMTPFQKYVSFRTTKSSLQVQSVTATPKRYSPSKKSDKIR